MKRGDIPWTITSTTRPSVKSGRRYARSTTLGLKATPRGRTVLMITHRLAPLAIADRVALVMDGRIERVGPPTEVMAYARIRMAEASRGQAPGAASSVSSRPMLG